MENIDNAIIIIRGAGERTEELCKKLILEQGISADKVYLIREVPFSAALRKSYQIGIDSGCKWTLCVDADVLLRPGSVSEMIRMAEKQPQKICEVQGFMLDKFFGGIRQGGVHLYRSSLLPLAIKQIPHEGVNIRPESYTLRNMKKSGYDRAVVPYVVGVHDEEQFNKDIYRKAFVYGVKHIDRLPLFVTLWKNSLDNDPDFKVALSALSESIQTTDQLYINSDQGIYTRKFKESGLNEKDTNIPDNLTLEYIEKRIENWENHELYFSYFPTQDGYNSLLKGYIKKIQRLYRRFGSVKLIGIGLKKIKN